MENQSQEEAAYSNQLESKMQVNMNKKEKMDKDKIQLWQREDKIQWHTAIASCDAPINLSL